MGARLELQSIGGPLGVFVCADGPHGYNSCPLHFCEPSSTHMHTNGFIHLHCVDNPRPPTPHPESDCWWEPRTPRGSLDL